MQFVPIVFSQSLVMAAVCFAVVFMWLPGFHTGFLAGGGGGNM